ncbi:sigma-70 family RNA polymerase sigma factor [Streptomyces piniterrae]|uniref:RNA polymerase sigma factor n=1 Tax=Streptomyces piniterrae TaxID=2571125 RepID=A0A4U0MN76_9ACTN|nr:sigma-70 family RNA polymerase sigma factor [Streptomyces piniterrae]TJZ42221.1 sigma-70 family RNA polymerase sigma factor [Streptomyces piniterrae]
MKRESGTATVEAARAGDEQAREQLVAAYLPLIYNVVGRALDGHADVDDVVQETMLRVLESLTDLREPASFRSWLVAIAMNQVRRRWTGHHKAPVIGLDQAPERADRSADFADLTILKLGLSGQRREVAAATRWLDEADRALLSLWWLEAAGEISRAELAAAIGSGPRHTAVRVQRMKQQLAAGRVVVRALAGHPPCPELDRLTASWDNEPCALWRKRISRHARRCTNCSGHWNDLLPAEGLLAGLALLPLPTHLTPDAVLHPAGAPVAATAAPASSTSGASGASGTSSAPTTGPHGAAKGAKASKGVKVAGAAAVAVAVIAALWWFPGTPRNEHKAEPKAAPTVAASAPAPRRTPTPTPSRTATTPPPSPSTPPAATPSATPPDLEEQATALVNARRARAGCGPLRIDPRLHTAAQRHSADMAARGYYAHDAPDGTGPDERITAAGYPWSSWGENLDRGPVTAAAVVDDWMSDAMHRGNLLNCQYTAVGIGIVHGAGGPWWTQDLAAPRDGL